MKSYHFRGKTYEIIEEILNKNGDDPMRVECILRDFQFCEEKRDYTTIENRILAGTKSGWLKEL
jgi:hypothetical protein